MKKVLLFVFAFLFFFGLTQTTFADSNVIPVENTAPAPKDMFYQATIVSISRVQKTLQATLSTGKTVQVTYEPQSSGSLAVNEAIVVGQTVQVGSGQKQYYFVDAYRVNSLIFVAIGFFALILFIVGFRGIGSIAGLLISIGVIFLYIVPQIISGADPLTVCMIGAIIILLVTTFVAHGISQQTITALVATLLALIGTFFLAQLAAHIVALTGYGDEAAVNLLFALPHVLNLKGLFLGGVILATVGALNDITITQAAAIFSLRKTHPTSAFKDLATEGYTIGREHALSLVNTLLLAFAGSSLAIFIFVLANPNGQPFWVILNSEFLVEEIVKIIAGTAGLLLAVPLVTLLAALVCDKGVKEYFRAYFR